MAPRGGEASLGGVAGCGGVACLRGVSDAWGVSGGRGVDGVDGVGCLGAVAMLTCREGGEERGREIREGGRSLVAAVSCSPLAGVSELH